MAINQCVPPNTYGPIQQTNLLGASIESLSCNLGWNEQTSSVSIGLVTDPCTVPVGGRPKVHYNASLDPVETMAADPGFFGAAGFSIIGTPCYVRWGSFEYCGIIKSWQESEGSEGLRYTVQLVDPREILEGVQLIVGDYAGTVGNAYNIFNIYGFLESFGQSCPLTDYGGAIWGTPAGGFGGAQVNENGMQWNRILVGLKILTSAFPIVKNIWSPYGRILFKGSDIAGHGLMVADAFDLNITQDFPGVNGYIAEYYLDLSELPLAPSYWRFPGPTISLMEAVSQICEDAGCDYYVELLPVKVSGAIFKIIKFRVVARRNQINLTSITQFLNNYDAVQVDKGRELRNEPTTSVLIGGYQQHIYQAFQDGDPEGDGINDGDTANDDVIAPFWGVDQNGNAIISTGLDHNGTQFSLYIKPIHNQIPDLSSRDNVDINVAQLRAALFGQDAWESFISAQGHHFATGLGIDGIYKVTQAIINLLLQNKPVPATWIAAFQRAYDRLETNREKINLLYKWIYSYADTYYGKKYMVRLPFSCIYQDPESLKEYTSEEPTEGGWTDESGVIGLPNNTIWTDFFKLDDGRVGPFCYFGNVTGVDFTKLEPENYIFFSGGRYIQNPDYENCLNTQPNTVWCPRYIQTNPSGTHVYIKADIEDKLVYRDYSNRSDARVVITVPDRVAVKRADIDARKKRQIIIHILSQATDATLTSEQLELLRGNIVDSSIGSVIMNEPGDDTQAILPDAIAVPLRSNVNTYGPWIVRGPAGAVKTEHDESLVPWNYGGSDVMNLAGNSKVTEAVTYQQVLERGSITVPGFPDLPLGAELGAVINNFFTANQHLVENRFILTETLSETFAGNGNPTNFDVAYVEFGQWAGEHGPNITAVDIQIQGQGISTTYNFQSFTPKFGRFSRNNADRLKQVGTLRLTQQKRLRAQSFTNTISNLRKHGKGPKFILPPTAEDKSSPAAYLVGHKYNLSGFPADNVIIHDAKQLGTEMGTGIYPKIGIMSLDGLLRPVSMGGDGGLPRYAGMTGEICSTNSANVQPPVVMPTDGIGYDIVINRNYLNPFTNPGISLNFSDKHEFTPSNSAGHDIDFLARGTTPPSGHHSFRLADTADTYKNDYRFLALRGPLVIHGWGYDTDGKPIPNFSDSELNASGGIFTASNLTDYFLDDFLRKSHTWPVAPVDLRFDRKRGVWVSPPPYKLIRATLLEDLTAYGTASGVQNAGVELYTEQGTAVTPNGGANAPKFLVGDVVGQPLGSGSDIIAYYDTDDCAYVVLHCLASGASGVGGGSGTVSIAGEGCNGAKQQDFFTVNRIAFATGLEVHDLGNRNARIELALGIKRASGCQSFVGLPISFLTPSGDPLTVTTPKIGILSGLIAYTGEPCSIDLGLDLRADMLSGIVPIPPSGFSVFKMLPGEHTTYVRLGLLSGLAAYTTTDDICNLNLGVDLLAQRTTGCFGAVLPIPINSGVNFTQLHFLSGFFLYTGAPRKASEIAVGLDLRATKVTGCLSGLGDDLFELNHGQFTRFVRLEAAHGMRLHERIGPGSCGTAVLSITLEEALEDTATFEPLEDLPIYGDETGNCKTKIFINADTITNYDINTDQLLGHASGGGWYWYNIFDCSGSI